MSTKNYWPENFSGAVSLTFDDGSENQLEVAVPMMNERKIRGTFYLCASLGGKNYKEAFVAWKKVFDSGHEIGNHTFSHKCSRSLGTIPTGGLEDMTLEEIEKDILEAEGRINEIFPNRGKGTFCYPCYMSFVGEGLTRQSYVPVVAKHFIAARASGEYGFFNYPLSCNLHHLTAYPAEHTKGTELVGLVERAMRRREWIIFAFHTIDGGRLGCPSLFFEELLDHLILNKERIWVAPVAEIASYVAGLRKKIKSS